MGVELVLTRRLSLLLVVVAVAVSVEPLFAGTVALTIDGREQCLSARPIVSDNTVLVPARDVFTAAGAEVAWEGARNTITIRRGDVTLTLGVGATRAIRNGRGLALEAAVRMINGVTYVPAVDVALLLGLDVAYERSAAVLTISGARQVPSSRPDAVARVFPLEGSIGKTPDRVSVFFDLRREGGIDFDSVRLFLDGRDVTGVARRAGTDDIPQSQGEISYMIRSPLAPGMHEAMVTYRAAGQTRRYAWRFHVQRC